MIHRLEQDPNSTDLQEDFKKITIKLFHYIKTHFADEEKFMKEIDFPLFEEHRKSHMALTNQARELLSHSDNIKQFAVNLETLIDNFIARHFAEEDLWLANFLDKAFHINEVHFSLDQYIMLRTLQKRDIHNEETYDYVCGCSLDNLRKVPKSIHEELENSDKLIKCRQCGRILVFLKELEVKENYENLKELFSKIAS